MQIQTYINFMGFDTVVLIDFEVTDPGQRPTGPSRYDPGDPGWGPEWDIYTIELFIDQPYDTPIHNATGKLFKVLANLPEIEDAILEAINNEAYH